MFQIGENASYHKMGGCEEGPDSCHGSEFDIMHFSVGNAIPGRLHDSNSLDNREGNEMFGHLVDAYAWDPCCTFLDGISTSDEDIVYLQNLKRSVREAALSSQSRNLESSQDSRSDDSSEHFFVTLSGSGFSRTGKDKMPDSLRMAKIVRKQRYI